LPLGLVLLGVGCSWFKTEINKKIEDLGPAGPRPANFDGASPAEAAKRVNFVPGSQVEIRQTFLGLGATLDKLLDGDDKTGVRIVTLERFAPMVYANLSWKLSQKVETEESRLAREAYEKKKATSPIGSDKVGPPDTVMEMQTVIGGLENIDLKNAHQLYPPAYWPSSKQDAKSTSAIWLSEDVFNELTKTRQATLSFGLTDENLYGALKTARDFADAVKELGNQATAAQKETELDLAKADEDYGEQTLKINGQDVKVQVFKARNWYGEITVLNNPQNPLILKMTFNPLAAGAASLFKGQALLPSLLGYEVTELNGVQ